MSALRLLFNVELQEKAPKVRDAFARRPEVWNGDYHTLDALMTDVEGEKLQVWELDAGDAYVLTSITLTKKMYVHGLAGKNIMHDWMQWMSYLRFAAKILDCGEIVIWTRRAGMARSLIRAGFSPEATSYALKV